MIAIEMPLPRLTKPLAQTFRNGFIKIGNNGFIKIGNMNGCWIRIFHLPDGVTTLENFVA
jgi:hypothetical protein